MSKYDGCMPIVTVLILLASAGAHAAWNIRLKGAKDPEAAAMIAVIVPGVLAGAAAFVGWSAGALSVSLFGLCLGVAAGLAELAYFVTLASAYAQAPISTVYPIVRGINPLIAICIGIGLLGERLVGLQPIGVLAIVAGLLIVRPPWAAQGGGMSRGALATALLAGLLSAVGSAIERVGTQEVGPVGFLALTWGVTGSAYFLVARQRGIPATTTPSLLATGLLIIGGHLLVMVALSVAPLSIVVPFRESAVLLVSGWGIVRAREVARPADVALRLTGAVCIVAGALLIALG